MGCEDFNFFKLEECVQRVLSIGQAIPIIGPVVISPIKLLVSIIEFVVAGSFALLAGTYGATFKDNSASEFAGRSLELMIFSPFSMLYSIGNMISLGLLGLAVELVIKEPWY